MASIKINILYIVLIILFYGCGDTKKADIPTSTEHIYSENKKSDNNNFLTKISKLSDVNTSVSVSLKDYENANIKNVDSYNLDYTNMLFKATKASSLIKIQYIIDKHLFKSKALSKIIQYATSNIGSEKSRNSTIRFNNNNIPTINDYINAGIVGIDKETINFMNSSIYEKSINEISLPNKIQEIGNISNQKIRILHKLYTYRKNNDPSKKLTVDEYKIIGLIHINKDNIKSISASMSSIPIDNIGSFNMENIKNIETLSINSKIDIDNDGTPDINDTFPLDSNEQLDSDKDGIGNNADLDDDNDGTPDAIDVFPLNPNESSDADQDGIGNNEDLDDDNDGTLDSHDDLPFDSNEILDTDGDGIGNNADLDDDNDGTLDNEDIFPLNPNEQMDTDGDGIGNNADLDDDDDGILDLVEIKNSTDPLINDSFQNAFNIISSLKSIIIPTLEDYKNIKLEQLTEERLDIMNYNILLKKKSNIMNLTIEDIKFILEKTLQERDTTKPLIQILFENKKILNKIHRQTEVVLTFSEELINFDINNINIKNGTISNFKKISNLSYSFIANSLNNYEGDLIITFEEDSIQDLVGNGNSKIYKIKKVNTLTPLILTPPIITFSNIKQPIISGDCINGDRVVSFIDNFSIEPKVLCTNGKYIITPYFIVDQGFHTVFVKAMNIADNISDKSNIINILVDGIAPLKPIIAPISGDNIINSKEKIEGIVINGTSEINSTVFLFLDDVEYQTKTFYNGKWRIALEKNDIPINKTTVNIICYAEDIMKNRSASFKGNLKIKLTEPVIYVDTPIMGDNIITAREDKNFNIKGETKNIEVGKEISIKIGDLLFVTTIDDDGKWELNSVDISSLSNIEQKIIINMADEANNEATEIVLTIKKQSEALEIDVKDDIEGIMNVAKGNIIKFNFIFSHKPINFTIDSIIITNGIKDKFTIISDTLFSLSVKVGNGKGLLYLELKSDTIETALGNSNPRIIHTQEYDNIIPTLITYIYSDNSLDIKRGKIGNNIFYNIESNINILKPTVYINDTLATVTGLNRKWLAKYKIEENDSGIPSIKVLYKGTNLNEGVINRNITTGANLNIDTTNPYIVEFSIDKSIIKREESAKIKIQFSEELLNFNTTFINSPGGSSSLFVQSDDNRSYTGIFTPSINTKQLHNRISLDFSKLKDASNNKILVEKSSNLYDVNTITYIDKIRKYADDNNIEPTIQNYIDTEITGVHTGNILAINKAISKKTSNDLNTSIQIQKIANSIYEVFKKIADSIDNNLTKNLTIEDYIIAGVNKINRDNINLMNIDISKKNKMDVNSTEKLQNICNAIQKSIDLRLKKITAYARSNYQPKPTIEDYISASIENLNTFNLNAVNIEIDNRNAQETDTISEVQAVVTIATEKANTAIEKIRAYYDDSNKSKITISDYLYASIINVNTQNLTAVNAIADQYNRVDINTPAKLQTLVNKGILIAETAYEKIKSYIDSSSADIPNIQDFLDSGVTGVHSGNINSINILLDKTRNRRSIRSLSILQGIADDGNNRAVTAIEKIRVYSNDYNQSIPTVEDYLHAGIISLNKDNLKAVNIDIKKSNRTELSTLIDMQNIVNIAINKANLSIEKIRVYSDDENQTKPNIQDYLYAGMINVDSENINTINIDIANSRRSSLNTVYRIQRIINSADIKADEAIEKIRVYVDSNYNDKPTFQDYINAGVINIDSYILDAINNRMNSIERDEIDTLVKLQRIVDESKSKYDLSLEKIKLYADDNSTTLPILQDYLNIGIQNIGISNINAVNIQIDGKVRADVNTISKIQNIVNGGNQNSVTALKKIQEYSDFNTNPKPTLEDYIQAGAKKVDIDNINTINNDVDNTNSMNILTIEALQILIDSADIKSDLAQEKIRVYADDSTKPKPTVIDYTNGGLFNVTEDSLTSINISIDDVTRIDIDTLLKIQELINSSILRFDNSIENIRLYAYRNTNPKPTLDDYLYTGITGVDIKNLDAINILIEKSNRRILNSVAKIQDIADKGDIKADTAYLKIHTYANDNTQEKPRLEDYINGNIPGIISVTIDKNRLKKNETFNITIIFSHEVLSINIGNLEIENGSIDSLVKQDDNLTYIGTFTPTDNITSMENIITIKSENLQDIKFNSFLIDENSPNYKIDTINPFIVSVTLDKKVIKKDETANIRIVFNEELVNFDETNIFYENGSIDSLIKQDDNITYLGVFTPTDKISDPTNIITIKHEGLEDLFGNLMIEDKNSTNYTIRTNIIKIISVDLNTTKIKKNSTMEVKIKFNQEVASFGVSNLVFSNGSISTLIKEDDNITYSGIFTPNDNVNKLTNIITVKKDGLKDLFGNFIKSDFNSSNYSIDTILPEIISITIDKTSMKKDESAKVKIIFTESINSFNISNIVCQNGLPKNLIKENNTTYSFDFIPNINNTTNNNIIIINGNNLEDLFGNRLDNYINSNSYSIDTKPPQIIGIINPSNISITSTNQRLSFKLKFDENIILNNGSEANVTILINLENGDNYEVQAFTTGTGNSVDTLNFQTDILQNIFYDLNGIQLKNKSLKWSSDSLNDLNGNRLILDGKNISSTLSNKMTLTTNLITSEIDKLTDGNKNLSVVENTIVLSGAYDKYIMFTTKDNLYYNSGKFIFYNHSESQYYINNSTVQFIKDGTITNEQIINNAGSVVTITPPTNIMFNKVKIIFNRDSQNFKEIEIFGIEVKNISNKKVDTIYPIVKSIDLNQTSVNQNSSIEVKFIFNKEMKRFDKTDIIFENGNITLLVKQDDNKSYIGKFTPNKDIEDITNNFIVKKLNLEDLVGNKMLLDFNSTNYTIDSKSPRVLSLDLNNSLINKDSTIQVKIKFSEEIVSLNQDSIVVSNGSISSFIKQSDNITYIGIFTPLEETEILINSIVVKSVKIKDFLGNSMLNDFSSVNYIVDTKIPTLIGISNPSHTNIVRSGGKLSFDLEFSESIILNSGKEANVTVLVDDENDNLVEVVGYVNGRGFASKTLRFETKVLKNGLYDIDGILLKSNSLFWKGNNIHDITNNPLSRISMKEKNIALASANKMTTTTNITDWNSGSLGEAIDGVTSAEGSLNGIVAPTGATGKNFTFIAVDNQYYSNGKFIFYNSINLREDNINNSPVIFFKDGIEVYRQNINNAGDEVVISPNPNIIFNEIRIIFNGNNQNFREIKIFAIPSNPVKNEQVNTTAPKLIGLVNPNSIEVTRRNSSLEVEVEFNQKVILKKLEEATITLTYKIGTETKSIIATSIGTGEKTNKLKFNTDILGNDIISSSGISFLHSTLNVNNKNIYGVRGQIINRGDGRIITVASNQHIDTDTNSEVLSTNAINKIKLYSNDNTKSKPTVQDYIDAKITGVNEDNIDLLNLNIDNLSSSDVDTKEKIQALVDAINKEFHNTVYLDNEIYKLPVIYGKSEANINITVELSLDNDDIYDDAIYHTSTDDNGTWVLDLKYNKPDNNIDIPIFSNINDKLKIKVTAINNVLKTIVKIISSKIILSQYFISNAQVIEGKSGLKEMVIKIYRKGDLTLSSSINWEINSNLSSAQQNESLETNSDYISSFAGSVTFNKGEKFKNIKFSINGDYYKELNEKIIISILNATNGEIEKSISIAEILEVDMKKINNIYSLENMNLSSNKKSIRVRRLSDNNEMDIGFNKYGNLDKKSLLKFINYDDDGIETLEYKAVGFVTTFYNQDSNTSNLIQVEESKQPIIVDQSKIIINSDDSVGVKFNENSTMYVEESSQDITNLEIYIKYQNYNIKDGYLFDINSDGDKISANAPHSDNNIYWDMGGTDSSSRLEILNNNFIENNIINYLVFTGNYSLSGEGTLAKNRTDSRQTIFYNGKAIHYDNSLKTGDSLSIESGKWNIAVDQNIQLSKFLIYSAENNIQLSAPNSLYGTDNMDTFTYNGEVDLNLIDGGEGLDIVKVSKANNLNLSQVSLNNIEYIDLMNEESNILTLNSAQLKNNKEVLNILMDSEDILNFNSTSITHKREIEKLILGNSNNNVISMSIHNEQVYGGDGDDIFMYHSWDRTRTDGTIAIDTILDFNYKIDGGDRINIQNMFYLKSSESLSDHINFFRIGDDIKLELKNYDNEVYQIIFLKNLTDTSITLDSLSQYSLMINDINFIPTIINTSLSSTSVKEFQNINIKHIYDAYDDDSDQKNISIALNWDKFTSKETSSYVVIMEDITEGINDNSWIHWNIVNIPSSITSLSEGWSSLHSNNNIDGIKQLTAESSVTINVPDNIYIGPWPGYTKHTYRVKVYALNSSMPTIKEDTLSFNTSTFEATYSEYILNSRDLTFTKF